MRIALAALLLLVAAACSSGHRRWSCAAHCVSEFTCSADGDSKWRSSVVTSEGDTAAAAFKDLAKECDNSADRLVTHFQCTEGHHEAEGASVENSCAAN